jgi:hypothetical protein
MKYLLFFAGKLQASECQFSLSLTVPMSRSRPHLNLFRTPAMLIDDWFSNTIVR